VAELRYRKDLFEGTAEYYDRFRPPYPSELVNDLRDRVPLDATSRVLDLACGTGQIAFALAADVAEVWAVDQEAEMIELVARKAQRLELSNVHTIAAAAEAVPLDGRFDLVAIGNAFHRLDRDAVARRLVAHLSDRGCVALLWTGSPWLGELHWQRVLDATLTRWRDALGARDRVPEGWEEAIDRDPHEQVLRRAGLTYEGMFEFSWVERWTVESLIGFTYSTSFLNRAVVGRQAAAFEEDLRAQLLACRPDGVFEQELSFMFELARRAA
jgi:SAM-dependent methyltransferase